MKQPLSHVEIIEMILANPPTNVRKFAREVGCSGRSVARVIARLESEGLITPRRRSNGLLWEDALDEVISKRKAK
jgi:DNA-binding MarR family transcriptional regulator